MGRRESAPWRRLEGQPARAGAAAPGPDARARALPRRYLLREAVVAWLAARFPKWPAIDAALSREGWKLVTLLRLSPLVPWNVLNYALSVTGARPALPYPLTPNVPPPLP